MTGPFRKLRGIFGILLKEKIFQLTVIVIFSVAVGAALVYLFERGTDSTVFNGYLDAIWWAVVTVTSVGYGDLVPQMPMGKLFAGFLMFFGIILTSILSGTIASIIVDRKLREGRGLETITLKKHLVICGWNHYAEGLLSHLRSAYANLKDGIVLVGEMSSEDFQLYSSK
ncbi:MAG TPA: potassium channel protein, partial [Spirochaetia bacterium]|nr:potassium channel protein [Spirochaetia bacterium]